ncbi:hypothetical protein DEVEQU_02558 [Devosia equisanguinis]|uniref:DUF2794 domain-containing protein n=1 Tax=Devosia equisanguinis TaxID=2490941 RepID=A0A447ID45_9HYPH|nr:hypothetical protein DEVEQU_02558 [Devosia equisanguinis]
MQGPSDEAQNRLALVHVGEPQGQAQRPVQPVVAFDRRELMQILSVYGRKVGAGEWRDYAMDFLRDRALFSIYARVSERPLFVIEKNPKLRAKQGQYMVTNQQGRILKRGQDLAQVLRVLDPDLIVVG